MITAVGRTVLVGIAALQLLSKEQFEKQVSSVSASARTAERQYRQIEKDLKGLFPEGARRSPFFRSVEEDFWSYRHSVKNVNDALLNLTQAQKDYAKLFSKGLLRSVDVITEDDENWQAARDLALVLDDNLASARTELDRTENFYATFSTFEKDIEVVMDLRENLENYARATIKEVSKRSTAWEKMIGQFGMVDTTMRRFSLYAKGDSVRNLLEENVAALDARSDSLAFLVDRLNYLLAGVAVSGHEQRAWDLYRNVETRRDVIIREVDTYLERGEIWGKQLENSLDLLETVSKMVSAMDDALAQLLKRQEELQHELETDSLRMTSLTNRARDDVSSGHSPYRELREKYEEVASFVTGVRLLADDALATRQRILEAAAGMISPDVLELSELNQAKKTFDQTWDLALDQADRFWGIHEEFNGVILDNFLNTPEYWEIKYAVEKREVRGQIVYEENFGYLYNPNAYPRKPYHGQLISGLQLRLRKEAAGDKEEALYSLVFGGSGPMAVEGIIFMDGSSAVYEVSRDKAEVRNETRTGGSVQFEWRIPVDRPVLIALTQAEKPVMRVHHLTLTHRINLTLFKKGLYRDYGIPKERLNRWKGLLEGKPSAPHSLFIGPPFDVPGTVGYLFPGFLLHRHAKGGGFPGRYGGIADHSGFKPGGVAVHVG